MSSNRRSPRLVANHKIFLTDDSALATDPGTTTGSGEEGSSAIVVSSTAADNKEFLYVIMVSDDGSTTHWSLGKEHFSDLDAFIGGLTAGVWEIRKAQIEYVQDKATELMNEDEGEGPWDYVFRLNATMKPLAVVTVCNWM